MAARHAVAFLCLVLTPLAQLALCDVIVPEPYCEKACRGGYWSVVRYGQPGLWCSFAVLGTATVPGGNDTAFVPWTDVVLQMDELAGDGQATATAEVHQGDDDFPQPVRTLYVGEQDCFLMVQSEVVHGDDAVLTLMNVTLCVTLYEGTAHAQLSRAPVCPRSRHHRPHGRAHVRGHGVHFAFPSRAVAAPRPRHRLGGPVKRWLHSLPGGLPTWVRALF